MINAQQLGQYHLHHAPVKMPLRVPRMHMQYYTCHRVQKKKSFQALAGFEPAISCLLDRRFNQLSHRALIVSGHL